MANRIPKGTQVIRALAKCGANINEVIWCYKPKEQPNYRGLSEDGKWFYIFTSQLRNSDYYDIKCFSSWDEAHKAGFLMN